MTTSTFYGREDEMEHLQRWLEGEPNALLFIFGPKSSGKSTLMAQVLEQLDPKRFIVNYLDLRGVLLYDFNSFLHTFFQKSGADKARGLIEGITINTGFFSISIDEEDLLKKNPFKVMETQLEKAREKGKIPVLVLDEIQMLKSIYFNGERHLIDELLNLFIRLTKVRHLAHVILLTSDSFFIEEIYNNAKLKKTMELILVEHLPYETVRTWLAGEGFTEEDITFVWEKLGGCAWEIRQLAQKVQQGIPLPQAVQHFLDDERAKLAEFLRTQVPEAELPLVQQVHRDIARQGYADIAAYGKSLNALIPLLVAHDLWFYRADKQRITANSESIRAAMGG
jgi:uncharacterized protein